MSRLCAALCFRCSIGQESCGPTFTRYSHHDSNFVQECNAKFDEFYAATLRAERSSKQRAEEARDNAARPSGSQRISRIKSEDRTYKASEKRRIFESPFYNELDKIPSPCYHRDLLGEDERKMWNNLPQDDMRRSTVFKGLTLRAKDDKATMQTVLVDGFGISEAIVAKCNSQKAIDQLWRDQMSKKYVPMSAVCSNNMK